MPIMQRDLLVGADGGVFTFGDAGYAGSISGVNLAGINESWVGMGSLGSDGYIVFGTSGTIGSFGLPPNFSFAQLERTTDDVVAILTP
jgi:hypothetical protein